MKPYETLTVCGKEYHLKITTAYAVKLEEELKTDIYTGLDKLAEIKTLAKYYFYAAVAQNDDINDINDVYQLIDDYIADGGTIEELQKFVYEILLTSGILTKEVHDASKKAMEKQREVLQKFLS
jgi:hypothetical protein